MKLLFVGDVVRQAGCDFLRRELPNLRRFYGADMRATASCRGAPN